MPLQTSGPISLANIQAEFGGSNPIGINEYTRGGTYVPNTPANSSIKASTSSMSFADYYGGSAVTAAYDFTAVSVSTAAFGTPITASIQFTSSGEIYNTSSPAGGYDSLSPNPAYWYSGGTPPSTWMSFSSSGGGSIVGGMTAGTRYALTTSRTLGISTSLVGYVSRTFTVSFWNASSGGSLLGTKTYSADAERF